MTAMFSKRRLVSAFEVAKSRPVANKKVANYRPNIPMTVCSFCGVENDYLMKDYIG